MTVACADCSKCGKCYPKIRPCPACGATVHFGEDDACPVCKTPITQQMIDAAMAEYREMKKREFEQLFGTREFHRPKAVRDSAGDGTLKATPVVNVVR